MGIKYFWDTYALIEFLAGNPHYAKFSQEPVAITQFNLAELFWVALRENSEEDAWYVFEEYRQCTQAVDDETLKEAILFRKKHYKKKQFSYADAIGYVYALKHNMKFLTGDKEFKGMDNVEFVK